MKFLQLKDWIRSQTKKDIFSGIIGHDETKWMLESALKSEAPIHILLVSGPGMGKTQFLKAIERMYKEDSYFALASGSTGAGMVNYCFENQPRFLLIDEIESMRPSDQTTLLSLLQDGVLVETKVSKTRRIEFKCSCFATCNSTKGLKKALLSRFAVIEMEPYTKEQFIETAVQRLGKNPLAEYIAKAVYEAKGDEANIRDCVRISEMAKFEQDVHKILRLVK